MANLERVTGKVFAGSASLSNLGVFGSAKAGTPTNPTGTGTEAQIQAPAAYEQGWTSAVVTSRNFPPIEEVNGVLRTISYQNCYLLQEGIPEYDINTEYSNTSVVKSINGNELSFYISLANNNIGNSLTDTTYWNKAIFTGTSAIGVPQFTLNYNLVDPPENCIWLEGAEVSRTTYAQLFAIYGTTYGAGDGSTTFNLPDFRNRTIFGGEAAGYISAGLPNITGSILYGDDADSKYMARLWTASGAFYASGSWKYAGNFDGGKSGSWASQANLDASRSSAFYGNSSTVQPPAIKCRVYTRYQ